MSDIAPLLSFDPNETYALTGSGIQRGSDQAHIPSDPDNADYRAYQAWIASGKTATPYTPPAAIYACQLWQLQAAMGASQWTQVQAAIVALNNPAVSAFFAHGTNQIPSDSTTLLTLGEGIGLTDAEIVALVQQASTIAIP